MKTLRIWFGCSLGLAISMLMGWDFGFLGILLPLFVLSLCDQLNVPLLVIIFVGAVLAMLQASILWTLFSNSPLALLSAVGVVLMLKCKAMTKKKTFIIGYIGLIFISILLHLSSYDFVDMEDLSITIIVYCLLNMVICLLAYYIFPEPNSDSVEAQDEQEYDAKQVVIIWLTAMVTFVVFQTVDLFNSVAAHASILVILAPLTCTGAVKMAKVRVAGTGLGCIAGLAVQLILGLWYDNAFLYWLLFVIAMGGFCYWHTQGKIKSAIASSAMAALTVPLTTRLSPGEQDAFFAILYRFSSIFVAVVIAALFILFLHKAIEHSASKTIYRSLT